MADDPLPFAAAPSHLLEAAVYCADLDAAERFYNGILGLERIVRDKNRNVFFRVGTGVLLVFNPSETVKPPGNPDRPVPPHGALGDGHVCLAVPGPALDDWRARLETAGVEIEADFRWPNGARSIYVRDPDGNSVELAEQKLWQQPI
ncbi:catechol 2,3-dioxygenase-like lactoylglutathione lyase family enzyme [Primorskyibacter sedentarius]|uniref:Catechol 2,3-dioxygenase-like lactoylglutathione lyase family enzyme n=1 Tax=Primorskyibacter sedentarius TaxID=745311 RepID=A0A4R3JCY1_9RHOB|nr:VOC family protein [Primorskyibacter sedentarius]TCS63889.1 catechol 2,3-dioxygenase-like lactoylglutathione lyase family enzyme [Primorskyibacter sedentarius]